MGEKAERTREKIRREAYQLFADKGFKEVTMTDVCEKTGLSRGGLYRHYSGTDAIFAEILSEEYVIDDRIEKCESAKTILEDMLETIQCEIMDEERSLSLAIYEYASLGNEDFFAKLKERAKKRWISLINYGIETREFKKVNPEQIAELILYYYQGLRMWSRVIHFDDQTAEYYAETIRQQLLNSKYGKDDGVNA